jgi:hypothetical protein
MDRVMLERHLTQVEAHIVRGEQHLTRQRELVFELERHGRDSEQAQRLLLLFEELQALHIADRDRIFEELSLS